MRRLVLVALLLAASCVQASNEVSAVAAQVVIKHVPKQEWLSMIAEADRKFQTWSHDHDDSADRGSFLNDKLKEMTCSIPTDVRLFKRVICWLALYEYYHEPLPEVLGQISEAEKRQYLSDLDALERGFTWEKALTIFRQRAEVKQ